MKGRTPKKSRGGVHCDLWPDYRKHLLLIGRIVTEFASLDTGLHLIAWHLLKSPELGSTIFRVLRTNSARIDVLRAIAKTGMKGSDLKEFQLILNEFARISNDRNIVSHGQWGIPVEKGPDPFVINQSGGNKNPEFLIYTEDDLLSIVSDIRALATRMQVMWTQPLLANRAEALQKKRI